MNSEIKGLIVYLIEVYNSSPEKTQEYCEKLMQKINQLDGWSRSVIPVRHQGSSVQVYALDEGELSELEPYVIEQDKLIHSSKLESEEQIKEYVLMMLGAPVFHTTTKVLDLLEQTIDKAILYNVGDIKSFVYDTLKEKTIVKNGIIKKKGEK